MVYLSLKIWHLFRDCRRKKNRPDTLSMFQLLSGEFFLVWGHFIRGIIIISRGFCHRPNNSEKHRGQNLGPTIA